VSDAQKQLEFGDPEIQMYENRVMMGGRAKDILASEDWKWLKDNVFGLMERDALTLLRTCSTDQNRLLAQQMYRAAIEPQEQMDQFVREGEAAQEILKQISNPEGGRDNEQE
jgi:hypothetical protein